MILLAWILFAAAPARLELVNEVYRIPPGEWRYVELGLKQQAAYVSASFESLAGSRQVRLALMRMEDVEHLRSGLPHGVMAVTPARVHLEIHLDFSGHAVPPVQQLSARRQFTVVLISFAVFFGIVSWSARRLLRAVKR